MPEDTPAINNICTIDTRLDIDWKWFDCEPTKGARGHMSE